jgi:hypothetical protein
MWSKLWNKFGCTLPTYQIKHIYFLLSLTSFQPPSLYSKCYPMLSNRPTDSSLSIETY